MINLMVDVKLDHWPYPESKIPRIFNHFSGIFEFIIYFQIFLNSSCFGLGIVYDSRRYQSRLARTRGTIL